MPTAADGERSYYLDDFTDEVVPCGTSLPEWAEWLSKPDPDGWPHDIPNDGDTFRASVVQWGSDIVARRLADGVWSFSGTFDDDTPSIVAVRFGPGLGWSPDNIIYPCTLAALREFLSDPDNYADDEEHIAVGFDLPPVVLAYGAHPPCLTVTASQQ